MKRKLEAELISIAHRILKLKNKSELVQLHQEAQKLYEKLSVLRFLEEQFEDVKPTIGRLAMESKLEEAFEEKPTLADIPAEPLRLTDNEFMPITVFMPEEVSEDRGAEDEETVVDATQSIPVPENQEEEPNLPEPEIEKEELPEVEQPHITEIGEEQETEKEEEESQNEPAEDEIIIRHVLPIEEIEDEEEEAVADMQEKEEVKFDWSQFDEPVIEQPKEEPKEEPKVEKPGPKEISFADLLGHDFSEPIFERVSDIKSSTVETPVFGKSPLEFTSEPVVSGETVEDLPYFKADVPDTTQEESQAKPITFGLNDKIGFEKHLFAGSSEDMNRVVSQLGSFNTFDEAKEFIEDMVKPDYNNWEGKEDYERRFMEIVERRFA